MPGNLVFAPEVEQDLAAAFDWYEDRRPGLGMDFLNCVDACIQRICRAPEQYAKVHEDYRRALIRRFPYGIFYEYDGTAVTVYAVFHTAREPNKWHERLR